MNAEQVDTLGASKSRNKAPRPPGGGETTIPPNVFSEAGWELGVIWEVYAGDFTAADGRHWEVDNEEASADASLLGSLGGAVTGGAKADAARANGALGGRPPRP